MNTCDMIIKNGMLVDPATGRETLGELHIRDGLIVEPAEGATAKYMLDAAGMYVLPGLIDFHAHVYRGGSDLSVDPATMPAQGVATVVDAGTAGTGTMPGLLAEMASAPLRMKAFVNITPTGLATFRTHEPIRPETFDVPRLRGLFREHADQILGIKFMAGRERIDDLAPLDITLDIASELGVPVVVHCTNPPTGAGEIARRLRKGDVFAHCFHGKGPNILGEDGRVLPEVRKARERGVIMDASNGSAHFSFRVAEAALREGFLPDVIATDLTMITLFAEPVRSLPHLMSKYLNMGLSLMDVARCCTSTPAALCRMEGRIGTLRPGAFADVTVLRETERRTVFYDTDGDSRVGERCLIPHLTVIRGIPAFRSPDMPSL